MTARSARKEVWNWPGNVVRDLSVDAAKRTFSELRTVIASRTGEGRTIVNLLFETALALVECIIDLPGRALRRLLGPRTEANHKLHAAADIVGCLFGLILLVLAVVAIIFVAGWLTASI